MTHSVTQAGLNQVEGEETLEDDSALLGAALDNPAHFDRLYERYVKPLYRYLLSKTGSVEEAEDLTSQTFLAALERLPGYNHRGFFSAWLFGIARNKWVDYYRRKKRPSPVMDIAQGDPQRDFLQIIIQHEGAQALSGLVNRLPEDERELLRLRLVAGLGFSEIAAALKRNEAAVKKEYYRLIERLKREMEQIYG